MLQTPLSAAEVVRRGKEIYQSQVRPLVETQENLGKVIVVDIESGEYEYDADHLTAVDRLSARRPDAVLYGTRIGFPTLSRRGGHRSAEDTA